MIKRENKLSPYSVILNILDDLDIKFNDLDITLVCIPYKKRKTRNHLEKYEKKLHLEKFKNIKMLASTVDLYFACLKGFSCKV